MYGGTNYVQMSNLTSGSAEGGRLAQRMALKQCLRDQDSRHHKLCGRLGGFGAKASCVHENIEVRC